MRWLVSSLVCVVLAASSPAQRFDLGPVDLEITNALRQWQVPGATVVIVTPDRIVLLKGYGECELGQPGRVDAETLFPLASCTKAFTTVALAMLVDEGKIRWDDPVRKHLPDFHLSDPHVEALVTIRDLVCHRTGLGSHDYLWYRAAWDQDEMIRRVGQLPLSGQFRSSFAYQSIMFLAAGKIVGKHHPRGWEGFVRERILAPLGMMATRTREPEPAITNLARGHFRTRDGRVTRMEPYPLKEPNAAGSIFTTGRDLVRWLQFQLGDGRWRGRRLVSTANLRETHRPQNIIPSSDLSRIMNPDSVQLSYGMGWVIQDYRGVRVLAHAGMIDGFRCQLTILPDHGLAIGIMNNLHQTRMNLPLTNRLVDLLLGLPEKDWHAHFGNVVRAEQRAKDDTRRRREDERRKAKPPSLPLHRYAGSYEHPAYGTATVRVDGNKLTWEWSQFRRELHLYHDDVFELRDVLLEEQDVTFVVKDGQVQAMKALDVEFTRKRE